MILIASLAFLFVCLARILATKIIISAQSKTKRTKKLIPPPEPQGSWPLIGHLHLLGGQSEPVCKTLGAIADKNGPIFSLRIGLNRLVVISGWEIVKDCFTNNDLILANRATIAAGKYVGYHNAIFALAPYGQYWRDIRKLATLQLLSNHRIELLKNVRLDEINAFIKNLHNCSSSASTMDSWPDHNLMNVVNITKLFESLTFNISLNMVVGKRYDSGAYGEENTEAWRYKRAIKSAVYLCGVFVLSDAISWLEFLDIGGYIGAMKRTAKELDSVIGNWLDQHVRKRLNRDGDDDDEDFMDVMLSNLNEGVTISGHSRDVIVKATALILTLTGAGSTSITLTWALSLLLNHPIVLKKARAEIDRIVGRDRWVQESDINNLEYLQAIIKETLRLYPPGPLTGLREAREECCIAGYRIPKGTRLVIDIWKLHRDPRVWERPDQFEPQRFLTTHVDVDVRGRNFEYIPFGSGRRSCPAINLGMIIVQLTLARLLQGFDFATVSGLPVDMTEGVGLALPKVNPVEIVIKPRLGSELYECL